MAHVPGAGKQVQPGFDFAPARPWSGWDAHGRALRYRQIEYQRMPLTPFLAPNTRYLCSGHALVVVGDAKSAFFTDRERAALRGGLSRDATPWTRRAASYRPAGWQSP